MSTISTADLEQAIKDLMEQPGYRPMRRHEIVRALGLQDKDRNKLRRTLRHLEASGVVARMRNNRFGLPAQRQLGQGILSVTKSGNAFLLPDKPGQPDVFIRKHHTGTALHGDRVLVELQPKISTKRTRGARTQEIETGFEGSVVEVLERHTHELVGTFHGSRDGAYVQPDNPRFGKRVYVRSMGGRKAKELKNHKVIIELDPWEDVHLHMTGTLKNSLGLADDPQVGMAGLMHTYQLDVTFPGHVETEARNRCPVIPDLEENGRRDLRNLVAIAIDPVDARDHDDAVSLEKMENGDWQLSVHIADVSHYVKPDDPIDKEALQRGTSVYLVDRVISMLPEYLTTEVCSLLPNVDRLAHTVSISINRSGNVVQVETFPSVIHSRATLHYEQVQKLLDGHSDHGIPTELIGVLKHMHQLARVLRKKRFKEGSIDLHMPEIRCVLDDDGHTIDVVRRSAHESYQLIEEFMLVANRSVAGILMDKGVPSIHRIHEEPDEERWEKMAIELANLGISAAPSTPKDINRIAQQVRGKPREHMINLSILRSMKRAMYSAEAKGHFGLGFEQYVHFTSPIRRYPDLMIHRMLKEIEVGNPPPYSKDSVAAMAGQCSARERQADEASKENVEVKRLEWFETLLQSGKIGPYKGVITGITRRGVFVELVTSLQKGMLRFSTVPHTRLHMADDGSRVLGRGNKVCWRLGDLVEVNIAKVNMPKRMVDFVLYDTCDSKKKKKKKQKDKKSKDKRKKTRKRKRR